MKNRRFVLASVLTAAFASGAMAQVMSVNASPITSTAGLSAAREFVVNVNLADFVGAVGAQSTVSYDSAKVEYVGAAGGDDFPALIYSSHNAAGSKVTFATGVDPNNPGAGVAAGNIAKLTFRTIASSCSASAVSFSTSTIPSRVTDANGTSLTYTESNNVSVTSLAPFSLSGVPSNVSVAADAGTTAGSLQTLTAPTASDSCGTALTVTATRSDSAAMSAYYPANATTTITYSATDAAGNSDSANVTVSVANYQLLDATFGLAGSISGSSSRSIRLSYGASSQVVSVNMSNGAGSKADIQLPIAASYGCMTAKDTTHSLSKSGSVSIPAGTVQYSVDFPGMKQGDSNNDNFVDILDFGIYVGDFGPAAAGDVSNFNDDSSVNNADFGFISLNYVQSGEACGGGFTGGAPRTAISVKQLRREGLGHLAASDLNRDGMLDTNDIVWFLQNGVRTSRPDSPTTPW